MKNVFKHSADDASSPRERAAAVAKIQQRESDEALGQLLEASLSFASVAESYNSVAEVLRDTNGLYSDVFTLVPTEAEVSAANLARETHGIEDIICNANGSPRGTAGTVKGSRARRRARVQRLIERSRASRAERNA